LVVAARIKPKVFARYFWTLKISLQMKVVPKSTKTPDKPTIENFTNFSRNACVKKDWSNITDSL
jgi:hypothetical protein